MTEASTQDIPNDFEALGLHPDIFAGVVEAGFRAASPIQAQAIPLVLAGHDLIGQIWERDLCWLRRSSGEG